MNKKHNSKILIVEVIPKYARLIKFALDDLDYSSNIISNLTNIDDEIRNYNPDLIIISPKLSADTHALCSQITSKFTCPILLGIYDSSNDDPQKALNAGAVDYFRLPANWDLFKTKVTRCLNEKQTKIQVQELITQSYIENIKSFSITRPKDAFCVLIMQVSNINSSKICLNQADSIYEQLSYANNIEHLHVLGNSILHISMVATNKADIVTFVQDIKNRLEFFLDLHICSAAFLYNEQTKENLSSLVHESFDVLSDKSNIGQDIHYLTNIPDIEDKVLTA